MDGWMGGWMDGWMVIIKQLHDVLILLNQCYSVQVSKKL